MMAWPKLKLVSGIVAVLFLSAAAGVTPSSALAEADAPGVAPGVAPGDAPGVDRAAAVADLIEQIEASRSALRTWRSQATIHKSTRPMDAPADAQPQFEQVSRAEFVWDLAGDALRVAHERDAPYRLERDGQVVARGTGTIIKRQVVKDGRLYSLDLPPAAIDRGGRRVFTISALSPGRREEIGFHPAYTFRSPLGVDVMQVLRDLPHVTGAAVTVTVPAEGDLVRVRFASGHSYNEYVFDRGQGGNLVAFHAHSPRPGSEPLTRDITIHYKHLGQSVWIPTKYEDRRFVRSLGGADGPRMVVQLETVHFEHGEVNEPVDESEFTLEALGMLPGDRVDDRRP
jgi:hypothetical protein